MHHQKVIHRDIKPDNILLTSDDTVQLADFGVSHLFDGTEDWLRSSSGSPAFYAPEVCSSATSRFHGKAVDIWAVGVTLYCFIFGRCPWESPNVLLLYRQIIHDPLELPETLNPDLADLLQRLLQKEPDRRIGIPEIREHPWTTNAGAEPMPSVAENCQLVEEITAEELYAAVKRSSSMGRRFREIFVRRRTASQTGSQTGSPNPSALPGSQSPSMSADRSPAISGLPEMPPLAPLSSVPE